MLEWLNLNYARLTYNKEYLLGKELNKINKKGVNRFLYNGHALTTIIYYKKSKFITCETIQDSIRLTSSFLYKIK